MNVNPSPLVLLKYFFTEVSLKSSDTGTAECIVGFRGGLGEIPLATPVTDVFPNFPEGAHGPYAVKLEVMLDSPDEKTSARYTGKVVLMGIFAFSKGAVEGENKAEVENIVMVNGNSMLYGMAREMIHNITARGPALPIILQTVNFAPPQSKAKSDASSVLAKQPQQQAVAQKPKKKV